MHDDILKALDTLRKGGVILYPTDTVWGLGCDATNETAVQKIFTIKKRSESKSMIVLLENPALLDRYIDVVPDIAWDLIEITTTPLTIIYPGARNLAKSLVANDGSIGIRFTRESFTRELLGRFRKPIVSTSANVSGQPTPSSFAEISGEIKSQTDYIVTYRQDDLTPAKPSGIIKLQVNGVIEIIRQ
jgi:L-threonylcarbamoyladenylate synthase